MGYAAVVVGIAGAAEGEAGGARGRRPHTGRRRNEAARRAILDAALGLLTGSDGTAITIDALAAAAGVGKQTIYRWWPSKAAVLAEAMTQRAQHQVPAADTGTLAGDLTEFLTATFRNASLRPVARALRTIMAEAQSDSEAAEVLQAYTAERRRAMRQLLEHAMARGELALDTDLDLVIDQAFGFVWYRMMIGHAPLSPHTSRALAEGLVRQTRRDR